MKNLLFYRKTVDGTQLPLYRIKIYLWDKERHIRHDSKLCGEIRYAVSELSWDTKEGP